MRQQVCWKTVARSIERPRMLLILSAFLWIWSVLQLLSTLIQRCGHRAEVLAGPISSACAQLCGTAVEVHDLGQRILYKIGRAHVCTPVTNAHSVCRLLLEK